MSLTQLQTLPLCNTRTLQLLPLQALRGSVHAASAVALSMSLGSGRNFAPRLWLQLQLLLLLSGGASTVVLACLVLVWLLYWPVSTANVALRQPCSC